MAVLACCARTASIAAALVRLGAVQAAAVGLQQHGSRVALALDACEALERLTASSDDAQVQACRGARAETALMLRVPGAQRLLIAAGGVKTLLHVLAMHGGGLSDGVAAAALCALANALQPDAGAGAALRVAGVARAAIAAMSWHATPRVLRAGIAACRGLAGAPTGARTCVAAGISGVLDSAAVRGDTVLNAAAAELMQQLRSVGALLPR